MATTVNSLQELSKIIGRIPKDAEFAGVVALTRTAVLIKNIVKEEVKKKFNLRNRRTLTGVKITRATKQKVEATVFTLDKWIVGHDEGGKRKRSEIRGKEFAVPAKDFISKTGVNFDEKLIPKRFRPKGMLEGTGFPLEEVVRVRRKSKKIVKSKARPFLAVSKRSGARLIMVRRTQLGNPSLSFGDFGESQRAQREALGQKIQGKAARTMQQQRRQEAKRRHAILWLLFKSEPSIKGRDFFEIPAGKTYDAEFQNEYDKAFEQFVKLR